MTAAVAQTRDLVDRRVPARRAPTALERARTLPRIDLDRNQVLDLEKIANGTFTPLEGFLDSAETRAVVEGRPPVRTAAPGRSRSTSRSRRRPPSGCAGRREALLWNVEEDQPAGTIEIAEIFRLDLAGRRRSASTGRRAASTPASTAS